MNRVPRAISHPIVVGIAVAAAWLLWERAARPA
jgi:hypothetical protein